MILVILVLRVLRVQRALEAPPESKVTLATLVLVEPLVKQARPVKEALEVKLV